MPPYRQVRRTEVHIGMGSRFLMWFLPLYLLHDVGEHRSVVPSHRFGEKQARLTEVCCTPFVKQF